MPPPGSGIVLSLILTILENQLNQDPKPNLYNIIRIVESFKYAYGFRTELGDPQYMDLSKVSFYKLPVFNKRYNFKIFKV